ncbi:MAG TPA: type IV pilus twitching motility protein PilT [bacterium]
MPEVESPPPAPETPIVPGMAIGHMRELFQLAFARRASDIHLTESSPPMLRIDGELSPTELAPLTREDTKRLVYSFLTDRQKAQFERDLELDISVHVHELGRFRVNVHFQRGSVEAAFRLIPSRIPTIAELGLPPVIAELTRKPNGLLLITGPTGVGKSTTMAAMVNLINQERRRVIVIIEDPIEFIHQNRRSIIKQREVYADTKSFSTALVRALRQDPDVIAIGEMRDLETIATAITAAETGHLVMATLHTPDAAQTVDRVIDVFPPNQQSQIQIQLADCLQGVVSQQLLPRSDRPGRVLAYEIMIGTSAVRNIVRDHATEQIMTALQTGAQYGMCTMDASIKQLFERKVISYETAMSRVKSPAEFHMLIGKDQPPSK